MPPKKMLKKQKKPEAVAAAVPPPSTVLPDDFLRLSASAEQIPTDQPQAKFERAMEYQSALSYVLDIKRVEQLRTLVDPIASHKAHTALLVLAYRLNDAEAIHVLLRENRFVVEALTVFQLWTFLAKPFYDPLTQPADEVAAEIQNKLKIALQNKLHPPAKLWELIRYAEFQIEILHDEYSVSLVLAMLEDWGYLLELVHHRQTLLGHACLLGFKNLLHFCLNAHILPDLAHMPWVTVGHPPLAYYALNTRVNKSDVRETLQQYWVDDVVLDDLCALELLALCCLLEDVEGIKQQLKQRLLGKDIKVLARQVLMGDLVRVLVEQDPDLMRELTVDDYQVIIVATQSAVLFDWVCQRFGSEFNAVRCLEQLAAGFSSIDFINKRHQQRLADYYAEFFAAIIARVSSLTDKVVEFIVAIAIQADHDKCLALLSSRFPENFASRLSSTFSRDVEFHEVNPLKAAVDSHARKVMIWLYEYMVSNNINIRSETIGAAADLLNYLLTTKEPDHALIGRCLDDFPDICCNTITLKNLFDRCLTDPIDSVLLQKVVRFASPYFADPLFNFYRGEHAFTAAQLQVLYSAFDELNKQLSAQDRVDEWCVLSQQRMAKSRTLQLLKEDPFCQTSAENQRKVQETTLYDFCKTFSQAADSAALENIIYMMLRRVFYLVKTNPDQLKTELTSTYLLIARANNVESISVGNFRRCTILVLLCYYQFYEMIQLLLILCPDLDFSEPFNDPFYFGLLSALCYKGNDSLARQLMESMKGRRHNIKYIFFEEQLSPIYIAARYGVSVLEDSLKAEILVVSDNQYSDVSDKAKLQFLVFIDPMFKKDESTFQGLVTSIRITMKKSLLEVAKESQDSVLVLFALKEEYPDAVPPEQRQQFLRILCLSPNVDLAQYLNLSVEDIMQKQDYPELGYLYPVDRLSICLSQLEVALNRKAKILVSQYCQLIYYIFALLPTLSKYHFETFLHLLLRFHQITDIPIDKVSIQRLCYNAVLLKQAPLSQVQLNRELHAFICESIQVYLPTDITRIAEVQRFVGKFILNFQDLALMVGFSRQAVEDNHLTSFRLKSKYQGWLLDSCRNESIVELVKLEKYFTAAVYLQGGVEWSADLKLLPLCCLLQASEFLPGIQPRLVNAIRNRLRTHPNEISDKNYKKQPIEVLVECHQQALVNDVVNHAGFRLISISNPPLLTQMCNQHLPRSVLEVYCQKISAAVVLNGIVSLHSPSGRSPLYIFYRASGQNRRAECVRFFIDNLAQIKETHSEQSLVELLALILEWLRDTTFSQYKRNLESAKQILIQRMTCDSSNYITVIRRVAVTDPQVLKDLIVDAEFLKNYIKPYHFGWLFNVALTKLSLPFLMMLYGYIGQDGFLFDLNQIYNWVDGSAPSRPLEKLHLSLATSYVALIMLLEVLKRVGELTVVVQDDLIAILKALIVARENINPVMRAAKLSQETLKTLLHFALQQTSSEVLVAVVDYYSELYPADSSILWIEDLYLKLLNQGVLVRRPFLLKASLERLGNQLPLDLIELFDALDEVTLGAMQQVIAKPSVMYEVLCGVIEHKRSSAKGLYKTRLQNTLTKNIDEINKKLESIEQGFRALPILDSVEQCEWVLVEMGKMLTALTAAIPKKIGLERYIKADPYQAQLAKISELQQRLGDGRSVVIVQQQALLEARKQQELQVEKTRQAELLQKEREEVQRKEQLQQQQLAEQREAKERKSEEERQKREAEERRSLAREKQKVAEDRQTLAKKQQNFIRKQRALTEGRRQLIEAQRKLAGEEQRIAEDKIKLAEEWRKLVEEQQTLALAKQKQEEAADEAYYHEYETALTLELKVRFAGRMTRASQNPQAQFTAIVPDTISLDTIVAIVPRAILVRDERGLRIEFTGEKEMSIDVGSDNYLYVINPPAIKEGPCRLSYYQGQWTILQKQNTFQGCIVKPLYTITGNDTDVLQLKHAQRVIPVPGFIPGFEMRPTAAPALVP